MDEDLTFDGRTYTPEQLITEVEQQTRLGEKITKLDRKKLRLYGYRVHKDYFKIPTTASEGYAQ